MVDRVLKTDHLSFFIYNTWRKKSLFVNSVGSHASLVIIVVFFPLLLYAFRFCSKNIFPFLRYVLRVDSVDLDFVSGNIHFCFYIVTSTVAY